MIAKFGNSKTIAIDYYSASDGFLTMKSKWETFEEMKNILGDPLATKKITIEKVDNEEEIFENYTQLEEIKEDKDGYITALMSQDGKGTLDRLREIENDMKTVQEDVETLKETGGSIEGNEELMKLLAYSADTLTDEEIVNVPNYVEKWKAGEDYKTGKRLSYLKGEKIQLYKVIQDHTSQADWTPDVTSSLYTPIGNPDEGTKENPITWVSGMESEVGKYYTDEGVLYIGLEDSKIGLHGQPKDLPRYFKVVE